MVSESGKKSSNMATYLYTPIYNVHEYARVTSLHSQLQTTQKTGEGPEDVKSDSEDGSSGDCDTSSEVPLTSTENIITIYVDDNSKEVATQTDNSELSSCRCDLVLQKLDQVLEVVELISSEMGVTTSDVYDIKQRCKAMENQLFLMVCCYT